MSKREGVHLCQGRPKKTMQGLCYCNMFTRKPVVLNRYEGADSLSTPMLNSSGSYCEGFSSFHQ